MKRFILFMGYQYYPSGGIGEISGTYDTEGEAIAEARKERKDWAEVLDTKTGKYWQFSQSSGEFRGKL